jgi:hypothetical protein
VLARDPPIDWGRVKNPGDVWQYVMWREVSIAFLVERRMLSKYWKVLMLFGTAHLLHGVSTAVELYEKDHPRVTLVIADHSGFGNWTQSQVITKNLRRGWLRGRFYRWRNRWGHMAGGLAGYHFVFQYDLCQNGDGRQSAGEDPRESE